MKKVFIILMLSLFLISCQDYDLADFTIAPSLEVESLKDMISTMKEKTDDLMQSVDSCTFNTDIVIINAGDDDKFDATYTMNRSDYIDIYQNQEYEFFDMDTVYCSLEPYLNQINEFLSIYDEKISDENTYIPSLTYYEEIDSLGWTSYQLTKEYNLETYRLTTQNSDMATSYLFNINRFGELSLDVFKSNEDSLYKTQELHFSEGHGFLEVNANSEGITYRKFDFVTGEVLIYQNQDEESYTYYNPIKNMSYYHNAITDTMTYYNDHGPYFSYTQIDSNVLIVWQLLEISGWDSVLLVSSSYKDEAKGIYQGDTLLFDETTDYIDSSLDSFYQFANVFLYQWFDKSLVVDDTLTLIDFGLTPMYTPVTLSKISSDQDMLATFYTAFKVDYYLMDDKGGMQITLCETDSTLSD